VRKINSCFCLTLVNVSAGVVREVVGSNGKLVVKITNHSRSLHEYRIYSKLEGIPGIPKVMSIEEQDGFFAMLMENAGVDIYQLWLGCGFWDRSFWFRNQRCYLVAVLAYQMVRIVLLSQLANRSYTVAYHTAIHSFKRRHTRRCTTEQFYAQDTKPEIRPYHPPNRFWRLGRRRCFGRRQGHNLPDKLFFRQCTAN
jgi:hypothetical protein